MTAIDMYIDGFYYTLGQPPGLHRLAPMMLVADCKLL